jgi:hypothetical protein
LNFNYGFRQLGIFAACFFGFWILGGLVFHEWWDIKMVDDPGPISVFFHYLRWNPEMMVLFFLAVWGGILFVLNRNRFSGKDPVLDELERIRRNRGIR